MGHPKVYDFKKESAYIFWKSGKRCWLWKPQAGSGLDEITPGERRHQGVGPTVGHSRTLTLKGQSEEKPENEVIKE